MAHEKCAVQGQRSCCSLIGQSANAREGQRICGRRNTGIATHRGDCLLPTRTRETRSGVRPLALGVVTATESWGIVSFFSTPPSLPPHPSSLIAEPAAHEGEGHFLVILDRLAPLVRECTRTRTRTRTNTHPCGCSRCITREHRGCRRDRSRSE